MQDIKTYKVGDTIEITGCGPDYSGTAKATFIYIDERYAIAHIHCGSRIYALGLNLNENSDTFEEVSREEVAELLDISSYGEYDVFLNFYRSE